MSARYRPVTSSLPVVYGPFRNHDERRLTARVVASMLRSVRGR